MNDIELLSHLRESAKDDFDYHSNSNKEIRERWVASELISMINIEFENIEFISPEQSSVIDVCFREARFQIKEITDPELRRGKLYKSAYQSLNNANSLEEVSLVGEPYQIPPISNMYDLVLEQSRVLASSEKYIKVKDSLDLLIYVTRTRAALIQQNQIFTDDFLNTGWRSVSCVNSKQAVVLFSSHKAPSFLSEAQGRVIEKH